MRVIEEYMIIFTSFLPAIHVGLFQASIINHIHPMNAIVMMIIDEIIAEVIVLPFYFTHLPF